MPKIYAQRVVTFSPDLSAICHCEDTRYGFRHLAQLMYKGYPMGKPVKVCYYNRTWKSFEFETVLHKLADIPNLCPADRDLIRFHTN